MPTDRQTDSSRQTDRQMARSRRKEGVGGRRKLPCDRLCRLNICVRACTCIVWTDPLYTRASYQPEIDFSYFSRRNANSEAAPNPPSQQPPVFIPSLKISQEFKSQFAGFHSNKQENTILFRRLLSVVNDSEERYINYWTCTGPLGSTAARSASTTPPSPTRIRYTPSAATAAMKIIRRRARLTCMCSILVRGIHCKIE